MMNIYLVTISNDYWKCTSFIRVWLGAFEFEESSPECGEAAGSSFLAERQEEVCY